jgi:hypothetical protein
MSPNHRKVVLLLHRPLVEADLLPRGLGANVCHHGRDAAFGQCRPNAAQRRRKEDRVRYEAKNGRRALRRAIFGACIMWSMYAHWTRGL